jgi:hypothetical protein
MLQIPYCQLLISMGHKILYISPHNLLEDGKDIITINPTGKYEAFQLKNGDITLPSWRNIEGEIRDLLTVPIQHSKITKGKSHISTLVVNGQIKDPVRTRIKALNDSNWGQQKKTKLETQTNNELIIDFKKYYGDFFPSEPQNFNLFLELYLTNGREMFPKEKYSEFIISVLELSSEKSKKTEIMARISSAVIFTSYILTPWNRSKNHIAEIEAWVCLTSLIIAAAEKFSIGHTQIAPTLELIEHAIESSFTNLMDELEQRQNLAEGDYATDTLVYGGRVAIVMGYLSAIYLYFHLKDGSCENEIAKRLNELKNKFSNDMKFIGEFTTPFFLAHLWHCEHQPKDDGIKQLSEIMKTLTDEVNCPQPYGWPNPYYSFEESTRIIHGLLLEDKDTENFIGKSYTLESIVLTLARRGHKNLLAQAWPDISHIQFVEFIPNSKWEFCVWRAHKGELKSRFPEKTQSWNELVKLSNQGDTSLLPNLLIQKPHLLLLQLLVFPHRISPRTTGFLDSLITK